MKLTATMMLTVDDVYKGPARPSGPPAEGHASVLGAMSTQTYKSMTIRSWATTMALFELLGASADRS